MMTRTGQTDNFKVTDFVNEITKYMGGGSLDYIVINDAKYNPELLKIYKSISKLHPAQILEHH